MFTLGKPTWGKKPTILSLENQFNKKYQSQSYGQTNQQEHPPSIQVNSLNLIATTKIIENLAPSSTKTYHRHSPSSTETRHRTLAFLNRDKPQNSSLFYRISSQEFQPSCTKIIREIWPPRIEINHRETQPFKEICHEKIWPFQEIRLVFYIFVLLFVLLCMARDTIACCSNRMVVGC